MQGNAVTYTYWPEILIGAATFIMSVGSSMFIAGQRWGEVRTDMRVMGERLARIEGMFTLKLRDEASQDGH